MRDLLELSEEIDEIDREITELYKRRTDIAGEVAEYKKKSGRKVLDRARERRKLVRTYRARRHAVSNAMASVSCLSRSWRSAVSASTS